MRKEEFYFASTDRRSRIHAVRYIPDEGIVKGVVQIVHGMAEYVERYEEFAAYLTARGYVVTGEDHLGHGKSVGENGFGYFCENDPATVVVKDVQRLKEITEQRYPAVPYIILGHSMGSFILRNYLCSYGTGIEGAIIMGTGMQPKALVSTGKLLARLIRAAAGDEHVSKFLHKVAFGAYNNHFKPARTPVDWLSKDVQKVDQYVADPQCGFIFTVNGFCTLFELIGRLFKTDDLKKIPRNLPVLIVSGSDDPVGDYGEGVRRTAQTMKAAGLEKVVCKLYPSDRHELLNETDRDMVMKDLEAWMDDIVAGWHYDQ